MGTFAALDQRIATRYAIKPMDLAESAAYLRHHMTLAGREEPLFADDAVARLRRVSSGLPRALNNAATAALIAAAATGQDLVDDACWARKSMRSGRRGVPAKLGRVRADWWSRAGASGDRCAARALAGAVTGSRVSHGGRHVQWVLCDLQRTGGGRVPGGA
jgi:hypothetical protein